MASKASTIHRNPAAVKAVIKEATGEAPAVVRQEAEGVACSVGLIALADGVDDDNVLVPRKNHSVVADS
jgi:hypothetical protein